MPAPSSFASRRLALYADIGRVVDEPLPDLTQLPQEMAIGLFRDWIAGPLLALGRQLVRMPVSDDPSRDLCQRMASELLRQAWIAADADRGIRVHDSELDPDHPAVQSARKEYEKSCKEIQNELLAARDFSLPDREKLNQAIREVAEPLLPRTHNDLVEWIVAGVEVSGPAADYSSPERPESLSPDEETILRELKKQDPRLIFAVDLSAETKVGDKTCKKIIRSFIGRNLAYRRSKRSGVGITSAGMALLSRIDSPISQVPAISPLSTR